MSQRTNSILIGAASLVAIVMLALAAGCTGSGTTGVTTPGTIAADDAPGSKIPATAGQRQKITVSGSTTVLPIVQNAADVYLKTHPNADIQISGGGSGVGIKSIGAKTVDIGMSSRDVTKDELAKYPDLVITTVAQDGIAIVVNPENEIPHITLAQIQDIYLGKITRWTEINGANVAGTNNQIVVIGRDSASGTRVYFDEDLLEKQTPTKTMLEKNSNGAVLQTVAQTPGAIGYVSIGFISNDVKAVPIWYNDQKIVAPSLENVKSHDYPVYRNLYVITNGNPAGLAGDFIDYMLSPEGQTLVAAEGYVTV
ncbi:MAG TPA: phosphate ABC transporter substrate-binding protein [Methanoregula sp.]|nr:phosphate ABC transporter substrate-binding protein [Methanoregula sp.]